MQTDQDGKVLSVSTQSWPVQVSGREFYKLKIPAFKTCWAETSNAENRSVKAKLVHAFIVSVGIFTSKPECFPVTSNNSAVVYCHVVKVKSKNIPQISCNCVELLSLQLLYLWLCVSGKWCVRTPWNMRRKVQHSEFQKWTSEALGLLYRPAVRFLS